MEKKPLFERIFYKQVYLGEVEKDGKIYKKYKKISRLSSIKKTIKIIAYVVAFLVFLTVLYFMQSMMYSPKKSIHIGDHI